MKTYGRIGLSKFLVLIDSSSNQNFMSLSLARVLNLHPVEEGGMDVTIASGEKIHSPGKCVQVPVEL
jgi:putative component of membrane protein insertase Oxa1/YidC/SpoIIIJ protein YidD